MTENQATPMFLIRSHKHARMSKEAMVWWGPGSCGYTILVDAAGRYTKKEADRICRPGQACPLDHEAWPEEKALASSQRVVIR